MKGWVSSLRSSVFYERQGDAITYITASFCDPDAHGFGRLDPAAYYYTNSGNNAVDGGPH